MAASCPIPTPEERRYGEIRSAAEHRLLARVHAALDEAAASAAAELAAAGDPTAPPSRDYFAATVHQNLYCVLCGADPGSFAGGRPEIALALIRNAQNVARHYWGADTAPDPTPARPAGSPPPAR